MKKSEEPPVGARIVRVDRPAPALLCLTLTGPSPHVLVMTTLDRLPPWGLVAERPRGEPARGATTTHRAALEGRTIAALVRTRDTCRVELLDDEEPFRALELTTGRAARVRLVPRAEPSPGTEGATCPDRATLERDGATLLAAFEQTVLDVRRDAYRATLQAAASKARRARDAALADASRLDTEATRRAEAELLLGAPDPERRGRTEVTVLDYFADPPASRVIALDPAHSPRERAAAIFARLRKLERGMTRSLERVEALEARIAGLDAALASATSARDHATLDALARAHPMLERDAAIAAPDRAKPKRSPERTFVSARGTRIRVGRGAADNDRVTGSAHPRDLFLHVRGAPGSHVILVHAGAGDHHPDDRLDAATLAAHFSSVRGEPFVEVTTALVKHVRKPRGAPAGTVRLERETVIGLRVEPDRLARLLEHELGRWH